MIRDFRAGFLFCGLGAGARGFLDATAKLGAETARFVNVGGVDNDPLACADFEYLTGAKAAVGDVSTMTPAELRAAWGDTAPDCVFSSPPCKGFSGLLSAKSASAPKYQALNKLVLQGMFLLCETWPAPPPLLVIENVPRIATRGAELLAQVRQLLRGYGYLFHEATHDCGEIGGLAQHRRRFLLVARRPDALASYVYRPPKRRVRACGEVLETLPMPEDPAAGEIHRLPRLSWLNWVRLALIPAGGDWRDLPGAGEAKTNDRANRFTDQYKVRGWKQPAGAVTGNTDIQEGAQSIADPRLAAAVGLKQTADGAESFKGRPGLFGVGEWTEPAPTVTGKMSVSGGNGTAAVADPRVPELATPLEPGQERRAVWARYGVNRWDAPVGTVAGSGTNGSFGVADPRVERRNGAMGVTPWSEPAKTVTGESYPSNGSASVADPRIPLDHKPRSGSYEVTPWQEPARTVRGVVKPQNGGGAVADPRVLAPGERWPNSYGVMGWGETAPTVRGAADVKTSRSAVADPRIALSDKPARHRNKYAVTPWKEPAGTVIGASRPGSGGASVADPRVKCSPRAGAYGVMSWQDAAATVTGSARIDNGPFAVADPRTGEAVCPIIVSEDGTWHRPLTTLELAVLQGLPTVVAGAPLKLAGRAISKWRERIGNAVPVQAAAAVAESLLTALLAGALGTWTLSNEGIWVRDDGRTEDDLLLEGAAA